MTATLDALWLVVEQSTDDWQCYLVLADALNDAGEERLEKAVRWMVREGKRPEYQESFDNPWVWYDAAHYSHELGPEMLQGYLFEDYRHHAKVNKSLLAAVSWLADQLERVGLCLLKNG